jgi:hypothetical protein
MKRSFAVVLGLAALGILIKLAGKEWSPTAVRTMAPTAPVATEPSPVAANLEDALRARYTDPKDQALVERTLRKYHHNALAIERSDGIRGLALLDRLDLEAIYLYEKYPREFQRLRDTLTDASAADLLLHWRDYFGLKRADETDRNILISEISRLSPVQRRAAAKYPSVLPLLLADPTGVTELIERHSQDIPRDSSDAEPASSDLADALAVLSFVSLEHGSADLRAALRTIDEHGPLALAAFRLQGLDGFALVQLYGPVLDALGGALPLDQSLILLRVNAEFVDELLRSHRPETVASHLRHVAAAGLVAKVGGTPNGLRLVVEHGRRGEQALIQAGPDAADVVYEDYADPTLRNQAVEALAEHGTMALAMLDKYATDPDFRDILRTHGAAVIPPVAQSDASPATLAYLQSKEKCSFAEAVAKSALALSGDNGQATIRTIKKDGLERVAALQSTDLEFYQFLPLYDLLHLGGVLSRGYTPTTGELTWALVDGTFVVADVLSLAAVQPEGAVAAEATRAQVKTATREAAEAAARGAIDEATEAAGRSLALARRGVLASAASSPSVVTTQRLARWWTVRLAGGTYPVLRRLPEALPHLTLNELTNLGRSLCTKAGLRLSTWKPLRWLKVGSEVIMRIPPQRGLKYVAAQGVQAGVGIIAFHKMEEHLASRRPQNP